jgi:hypothetical protein
LESLKKAGFFVGEGSVGKNYASLHLATSCWEDNYKALGAVYGLCAMHEVLSPLPPLAWLKETLQGT